ncbi:MAG: SDR family NAD(P)-dependent oxidoreductase [Janthinobacterium lividum]
MRCLNYARRKKEITMSYNLTGKVTLVTGASKGIGAAIAKRLAAEGSSVIVNYVSDKAGADQVVGGIVAAGGKATAVQADVSKPEEIERLFAATKETYGRLDVLVNNAGVFAFMPLEAVIAEEFHRQMNLNVLGTLLASKAAAAAFGELGGSIINLSSSAAVSPMSGSAVYSATKAAVDVLTRALAMELGPRGIRVNAVSPGPTETQRAIDMGLPQSNMGLAMIAQTPLGRFGQPEDMASVAAFLASDDAGWITGQVIQVSGGLF